MTGPLFLPEASEEGPWRLEVAMLGEAPRLLPVPTHFYKVLLAEDGDVRGWLGKGTERRDLY